MRISLSDTLLTLQCQFLVSRPLNHTPLPVLWSDVLPSILMLSQYLYEHVSWKRQTALESAFDVANARLNGAPRELEQVIHSK